VSDVNRETLVNALRTFANESEKADWAVVYYSGHGIEVNGSNYLIPVEANIGPMFDEVKLCANAERRLNAANHSTVICTARTLPT